MKIDIGGIEAFALVAELRGLQIACSAMTSPVSARKKEGSLRLPSFARLGRHRTR